MKVKTILFAFLTWLIPIAVSLLMYNPETNSYLPNLLVFKLVMISLLGLLTFFFFKKIKTYESAGWLKIATVFTIVCSLLDLAVLVPVFKIEPVFWAMAILPFYLISFYGFGLMILRKKVIENA